MMARPADETPPIRARRRRLERLLAWGCGTLLALALLAGLAWWFGSGRFTEPPTPSPTVSPSATATPSPTATLPPSVTPSPTAGPPPVAPLPTPAPLTFPQGLTILSLRDGLALRLFAYDPHRLPLSPITPPDVDAITPALSPDGKTLAYAANLDGTWDLYLLDLSTGEVRARLTDTPAYDASPSWSPDGRWLVYEAYLDDNLELLIRDVAGEQAPLRLTAHPAADFQPAWSPQGRLIAFVSTREGLPQIFVANLDQPPENRLRRVSDPDLGPAAHPAWSPDGRRLAWSQVTPDGLHRLYLWDATHPDRPPRFVGQGDWPMFAPQGEVLLTVVTTPRQAFLTGYRLDDRSLALPMMPLPGPVHGFTVGAASLAWPLPAAFGVTTPGATPTPLWTPALTPHPDLPAGRLAIVPLPGVEAPRAELSDAADEAFAALRQAVARAVGWDALGRLRYAYMPITENLLPGQAWLHTGRAFALSDAPLQSGWLAVVREDYGAQTYWRVYLRAHAQDGSQGMPLHALPWNFYARYRADPMAYEAGGAYAQAVPPGYWVDFTELAAAFGWERLPAATDWRAYLPGARWDLFALRQGLTWEEAMAQIVPPEILLTPTPIPTPSLNFRIPTPTEGAP